MSRRGPRGESTTTVEHFIGARNGGRGIESAGLRLRLPLFEPGSLTHEV